MFLRASRPALLTFTGLPALSGCTATPGAGAWFFVSLALVAVAGGFYALGRARGARKHEQHLRQTRAELRQWSELADAWAWRTDASHRLQRWRAPASLGTAAAAPAPINRPLASLFVEPGNDQPDAASLTHCLRAERAFSGLRLLAGEALGGQRWVLQGSPCIDDQGRFDGFAGSARPLAAEEAAHAGASALEPLLAAIGPAALALDHGDGWTLQRVNPAAQAQWPGALPGRPLADWLRALPAGVGTTLVMLENGRSADVSGWRLTRFDALSGPGLRAPGLLLTQLAAAPTESTFAAEADQFSLTVSHDLRAPIRVVEGFTRIVKEDYGRLLDRVGNDHLDRVLGAAARMNLMIDALLTLARLSSQPLARQPVNLSQLAGYVMEDLRRSAPEREADIEIEPGLSAHGDPTLLRLVLENLLGNAWKYTARCPRTHIVLRTGAPGPKRAFEVRDNGAGFDMRSAERLFGLFQRLHSANDFPGHGVGLASVKRIVQRHGGEIWAEAEPGRGAAFHFTLAA